MLEGYEIVSPLPFERKWLFPPKSIVYIPAVSSFLSSDTQLQFKSKTQEELTVSYHLIVNADAKNKFNKKSSIKFFFHIINKSDNSVHDTKITILRSHQKMY